MASLLPPPPFECEITPKNTNSIRWPIWQRKFNNYLKAIQTTDEDVKISIFLHVVGETIEEIYQAKKTGKENKLEAIMKIIDDHFKPQEDIEEEINKFRDMYQLSGESIDAYFIRLTTQSVKCDFKDRKELEIKLQLLKGCSNNTVKIKAKQDKLDVEKIVSFAKSLENIHQSSSLVTTTTTSMINTNNIKKEYVNQINQRKTCGLCGGFYPHNGLCRAKNQTCNKCGKLNHFAKMCRSGGTNGRMENTNKQMNHVSRNRSSRNNENSHRYSHNGYNRTNRQNSGSKNNNNHNNHHDNHNNNHQKKHHVNQIETTLNTSTNATGVSNDSYSIYKIDNHDPHESDYTCPRIDIVINDTMVDMGIDTQASVNAVTKEAYNRITPRPRLEVDYSQTYAFDSKTPIKSLGKFKSMIRANGRSCEAEFIVFEEVRDCLLSFETSKKLKLINLTYTLKSQEEFHKNIVEKYSDLFTGRTGKLKDFELELLIDTTVKPVYQAPRRIPFALRDKVEAELEAMERDDLIEDAKGPITWVSEMVIVPKPNDPDSIRIVVDSRQVNKAIHREQFYIPTIDDIICELNGAKYFSKLDLKGGYHQIVIKDDCRYITTFRTPQGLKRYKRLTMGFKSASEQFQEAVRKALYGLSGTRNLADDIFVFGDSLVEHDKNLYEVLDRLLEVGLTLNIKKCEFRKTTLEFFGMKFSGDGISITDEKIRALKEAGMPKTQSELRSFLGLASYCSRSIPNYASISNKLWKMVRSKSTFEWNLEHTQQFNLLKDSILSSSLSYFKKDWLTNLEVDASPVGAGAVLYQTNPNDHNDNKIVTFWSQLFTDVECKYSQVEKEALAIVLACEKLKLYLIGTAFNLITDNKALEIIFKNPSSKPPARIERWGLRLMSFNFNIQHKPGKDNVADYFSRNAIKSSQTNRQSFLAEQYIHYTINAALPQSITLNEWKEATDSDHLLQKLIKCIEDGFLSNETEMKPFKNVFSELSVKDSIVLMNRRIVVPSSLRTRACQLAHEGHQGVIKTKRLLRERVWFPSIDQTIEDLIQNCSVCQLNNGGDRVEPLKISKLPIGPWEEVSIDFHGPLFDKSEFMVVIDNYSRFPVVINVKSTSAQCIIPSLDSLFSLIGIPKIIRSDNGPPFNGYDFANFCSYFGIVHNRVTPLWPQANGLCENFNKNLKKVIQTSFNNHSNWRFELNQFLRSYRSTPHSTTNIAPSKLVFTNANLSRLPKVELVSSEKIFEEIKDNDSKAKTKMKEYADLRRRAVESKFQVGDRVLLHRLKNKKLYGKYENKFSDVIYVIKDIKGSMVTAESKSGHVITRNSSFFKTVSEHVFNDSVYDNDNFNPLIHTSPPNHGSTDINNASELPSSTPQNAPPLAHIDPVQRPIRVRKMPVRYDDYLLYN